MAEVYDSLSRKHNLNICEAMEVFNYIRDFEENVFQNFNELNNYITKNDEWEYYPSIRSLNTHGNYRDILGIQPKFYTIVCKELNIKGGVGKPLNSYKIY